MHSTGGPDALPASGNDRKGIPVKLNRVEFVIGLFVALGAGTLLFFGITESGPAALIGIVGIGLIGASSVRRRDRF